MGHVYIEDLPQHMGESVTLKGWLAGRRKSGKLLFLQIRDGSGFVQCVAFKGEVDEAVFDAARHVAAESSVIVQGEVRAHTRDPGAIEVGVTNLEVIAEPTGEYPISPKAHGTDFLMDHRHLWLRSTRQHAIMRVRAELIAGIRDYFDSRGFTLIDSPIFTPNACEGTSTLFETDFHGSPAYLTQSGQLYNEAAAAAFGRVYCFGPTFRAEKSKTRRHLAEFWMIEPEVAFLDLEGDMDLAEDLLASLVARVLDRRSPELRTLERDTALLERVTKPFPRIRYAEAIDILTKQGKKVTYGDDFGADEETAVSDHFDKPVIVSHYPVALKAFYFKRDPDDPGLALNMDILAPEGYGEIVGGGQREDDLERLDRAIAEHQLPREAFDWYLDLRRYGSFPHAGFGLGLERAVAWICGLQHVRETIPFPRMLTRLHP